MKQDLQNLSCTSCWKDLSLMAPEETKTCQIALMPSGRKGRVPRGANLLKVAEELGVEREGFLEQWGSEEAKQAEVRLHEAGILDIHVAAVYRLAETVVCLQGGWQFAPVCAQGALHQAFHDSTPGMCLKTINVTTSTIAAKAGTPSQNHHRAKRQ